MAQHRPDEPQRPTSEELAAYVDGELNPAAQRSVEHWLAAHPQERAEVETQRSLNRLWADTAPTEPGDEAWSGVLARVADAAAVPAPRPRHPARRIAGIAWLALGLVATAATLLVAFWLARPSGPTGPVAVLPVLTGDEVEIISMDAADVAALVVGELPRRAPLVMASVDEVTVHEAGEDVEILMPDENDQDSPAWPLVLVPGKGP